jgi:hypothetical protein
VCNGRQQSVPELILVRIGTNAADQLKTEEKDLVGAQGLSPFSPQGSPRARLLSI